MSPIRPSRRCSWRHLGDDRHPQELLGMREPAIAYLVSRPKGWRARIVEVFDLERSDQAGEDPRLRTGRASSPAPPARCRSTVHGLVSTGPKGNRVYLAYGTNRGGILQIVDREKLLQGTEGADAGESALSGDRPPGDDAAGRRAHRHAAWPQIKIEEFAKDADKGDREFVMIVNETFREECGEARQMVWFVDTTIEKRPMVVSNWTVPEASGNFCTGVGASARIPPTRTWAAPYYQKLTFITFFNAGVRVLDVRNPYQPKEVGYFIPPITARRPSSAAA